MTRPDPHGTADRWDRRLIRAASLLTLFMAAWAVFLTLTDLPFDHAARRWMKPAHTATQGAPPGADDPLGQLAAIKQRPAFARLNALSCWYLPYTPHELLAARLNQGGAGAYPRPDCPARAHALALIREHASLLGAFDALAQQDGFTQPAPSRPGPAGQALAAAIGLELGRIALDAARGPDRRRAALGRMAGRLGLLRRIAAAENLDISLRAAAMQGVVYILRLAPVLIGDDAALARRFRRQAGAALDAFNTAEDTLENAMRLHVAVRAQQGNMPGGRMAATPGSGLMVLKPVLYARLVMDMTQDVLEAYTADAPAASLNALRRKVDNPLDTAGAAAWLHPVQTAALEPVLKADEAALVGFLIDLIQFNELRRMLLVNIVALEQDMTDETMAQFVLSGEEPYMTSTLTGRPFSLDPHAGDIVARPAKDDKLAYTIRLYMGRGGGSIKAGAIWPPGRTNHNSPQATP